MPPTAPPSEERAPEPAGPPPGVHERQIPWAQLKYPSAAPVIYPAMLKAVSRDARPGDLVTVYDKGGHRFGAGLYNPKARVPLRMFHYSAAPFGEHDFLGLIDRALDLRLNLLRLPETTDAFRAVHSDGDGLSGLIVDKFGDVLSVEVHSLGVHQRLAKWLPRLHERLGTKRVVVEVDDWVARVEGIKVKPAAEAPPRSVKIREHGIRYEVDFEQGHKTGFFCDQRENRLQFAQFTRGARVLDLCCYTGGFSLAAKVLGGAAEVTGVDLDEKAIAQARRNANLNNVRVEWVHCDAFSFARQMQRNGTRFPVVLLDPPKFIHSREDEAEGRRKYEDLSGMGMNVLAPGGLLVTCSCSGLIDMEGFERLVVRAAYRLGRRLQFLDRTGAGADHPVMANCPESRYLKVLWARVF